MQFGGADGVNGPRLWKVFKAAWFEIIGVSGECESVGMRGLDSLDSRSDWR